MPNKLHFLTLLCSLNQENQETNLKFLIPPSFFTSMASHPLLLSLLLTTVAATTTMTPSPSPLPSPTPSPSLPPFSLLPQPPPPSSSSNHQVRFNTIIDALIGAGDFGNWANFLSEAVDPTIIPISATLFVPDDDALLAGISRPPPAVPLNFLDPLLFPYHIVARRLSFSELRLFPDGVRLPTLLTGFSLLITNHSVANFTINGARLTRPDLFQNALVSVHGVGAILDYTLFGKDPPPPVPEFHAGEVSVEGDRKMAPATQVYKSGAPSCRVGFWVVRLVGLFVRNRD